MTRFQENVHGNIALWHFGIIWLIRPESYQAQSNCMTNPVGTCIAGLIFLYSFLECLSRHSIRMATTGATDYHVYQLFLVTRAFMEVCFVGDALFGISLSFHFRKSAMTFADILHNTKESFLWLLKIKNVF